MRAVAEKDLVLSVKLIWINHATIMVVLYGCFVETYINTLIYACSLTVTLTLKALGAHYSHPTPSPNTQSASSFSTYSALSLSVNLDWMFVSDRISDSNQLNVGKDIHSDKLRVSSSSHGAAQMSVCVCLWLWTRAETRWD